MANYYVIQTGTTPPNLTGTPYEGFQIKTVAQMNNPYVVSGGQRVGDGDQVVVDGSVSENLSLNPANGTTSGFKLDVTVLPNSNSFTLDISTAAGLNYTEPNLTVNVLGDSGGVNIGGADNVNALTVNVAADGAIGNVTGGNQATDTLVLNAGEGANIGNIIGAGGADQINIGLGATAGNINLRDGNDTINNNGSVGRVDLGGGTGATDSYIGGAGSSVGDITSSGAVLNVSIGDGGSYGNIGSNTAAVNSTMNVTLGQNVTGGDIKTSVASNPILNLEVGDGSTVGDIQSGNAVVLYPIGFENGGSDHVVLGTNVTTGHIDLFNGDDTLIIGDGSMIDGHLRMGDGSDSLVIGENVTIREDLQGGAGVALANEDDYIEIGAGTDIGGYVHTGGGNDTLIVGDDVTVSGDWAGNSIYTYIGNDSVTLGDNLVLAGDVNTGQGSDTVIANGGGNYTVNQEIAVPNNDLLIINYLPGERDTLLQALVAQGFSLDPDAPYDDAWFKSSNSTFDWNGINYTNVDWVQFGICFGAGTMIETATGPVAVEDLREGDLVLTRDNGPQPLRWIGANAMDAASLRATPTMQPIRIRRDALGAGLPSRDLIVSPQHRVLVRSNIAQRMFGTDEILVAAKQLLQIDGIDLATDMDSVTYFHFLFDRHEIVIANGAETESLFTGPQALKTVGRAALDEIFAIFPELRDRDYTPVAARPLASGRMGRKLAVRHAQNGKPLVR